jgi:hypothetical protein
MRKLGLIGGIVFIMVSCKTSSHKCDAYGDVDIDDIHKINIESQKKYCSYVIVK